MIRILHVIGAMGSGGAEAMIMNYYRHMDRTKIQFDFVVHTEEKQFYDDEITRLGGRIFRTEKYNVKNYFSYKKWWNDFLKSHMEYRIVHGHIGSSAPVYLQEAKKAGRIAIAHSHSAGAETFSIKNFIWKINSFPTRYIAEYFFACSKKAAENRFGKYVGNSEKTLVLKNAVDCERFRYSEKKRLSMRKKLGIENNFVIGHVGRFTEAKNHSFLIEVFRNVLKENEDARLLLVGGGELEHSVRELCEEKGILQAVIFAGVHKNTEDYYAAMDVFCFPSIFEGLPCALIEAQASGLPCVIADNISEEVNIGADLISKINLSKSSSDWTEEILKMKDYVRKDTKEYVIHSGYDIETTARQLAEFYINLRER